MILRPYQSNGVEAIRDAFRRGIRRVLYVLPTGGGKTACFGHIANAASNKGNSANILVHRQELLLQASAALTRLDTPHGLISPLFPHAREAVQVSSVQTLIRRLGAVLPPDLIIVDEAHHSVSPTYRKIFDAYPNARILGVTATPVRTNGDGLGEIFQEMILGPSIAELIEMKFLVQPEVYAPPIGVDLKGIRRRGGDFDRGELQGRIDRPKITGCAVEHYQRLSPGEPAIAFCVSIDHAEHVAAEFRAAGIRAKRVDGKMPDDERKAAIAGLGNGEFDVITSADLIGEGVDVPRVSAAILLRPTESLALYLQQVGRALRPFPGKKRALVLDHVENWTRHGFPDDPREWTLEGVRRRRKLMDAPPVKLRQCEKCYYVFEWGPDACPSCGHNDGGKARKIREEAGELERITREQAAAMKLQKRDARAEQGMAATLEDLITLGKKRGVKNPGFWAQRVFNNRRKK